MAVTRSPWSSLWARQYSSNGADSNAITRVLYAMSSRGKRDVASLKILSSVREHSKNASSSEIVGRSSVGVKISTLELERSR